MPHLMFVWFQYTLNSFIFIFHPGNFEGYSNFRILLVSVDALPFFFPGMCTCACRVSCNVLFSNLYFHYDCHNLSQLCYSHVSIDRTNAHQCTDDSSFVVPCFGLGRSVSVHLEEHNVAAVAAVVPKSSVCALLSLLDAQTAKCCCYFQCVCV